MRSRRLILVRGLVQGVGFRPYVFNLARQLGLAGFVRNQVSHVAIEVEGDESRLDQFARDLPLHLPPLASIQELQCQPCPVRNEIEFRIEHSSADGIGPIYVGRDLAPCPECLAELFDPADRRYRYPFLNCTQCGPRLTIVTQLPYDRSRTTLAGFPLCAACQAEYDDPAHRRFHAQPTACPACGPQLSLLSHDGQPLAVADPLAECVTRLRAGQIGALKGLGGFHLLCDARSETAVAELRRRKARDDKPFALMVADLAAAEELCELSPAERALLTSVRRPIVLLRRRTSSVICIAPGVAGASPDLGLMLPYTPLHELLLHDLAGRPVVMTSGNRSDEPLAYEDDEAVTRLAGIVDFFLTHNRRIHLRCEDSVTRIVAGSEAPVRRSRGEVPQRIALPQPCAVPLLAVGGQLKSAFALGSGPAAVLGPHLGDLHDYQAVRSFADSVAHFERLFAIRPQWLIHDLHPDYASTRYARERAAREPESMQCLAVQHHEAHIASCLADNGLHEPVIGVACDGTGFGRDGAIWGGEFFVGDCAGFQRAAHLRYVPLPGGDRAIREPWRMAAAWLIAADEPLDLLQTAASPAELALIRQMIARSLNAPLTSSMGRLFDGVAALAGIRHQDSYEGQAAVELEWRARAAEPAAGYPFDIEVTLDHAAGGNPLVIDPRPVIRSVVRDLHERVALPRICRRFQTTVVDMIATVCQRLREQTGLNAVALSGGVFLNALLLAETNERLTQADFRVYRHRQVPTNDGGLCLGQLALAAATIPGPNSTCPEERLHVSGSAR